MVTAAWRAVDQDGSGALDREELAAVFAQIGEVLSPGQFYSACRARVHTSDMDYC